MVREAIKEDLQEVLELYLFLHEKSIPEQSDCLSNTYNQISNDKNSCIFVNSKTEVE